MMKFVNGKDDIPDMKWKIKFMFETTSRECYTKGDQILANCSSLGLKKGDQCHISHFAWMQYNLIFS